MEAKCAQQLCQRIQNVRFSRFIDSDLIESFQEEFSHCSVHDVDQVQQLGVASAHFHPQKRSANYKRREG